MAVTTNITVSEILNSKSDSEDGPKKKSREDWRKAKELEEARKAGTAPAAVDEEGRDINPHIPQYISSAPWYFGSKGPTLKHQRIQEESIKKPTPIDLWYKRGVNTEIKHTKYRKGACDNCGAITHKRKECMERPRKVGAKFSNAQIAPDEFVQPIIDADYDGKRDRWAGYDPSQHHTIVEQYHKIEEAKRQLRAEKLNSTNEGEDEELDDEEDEDKYVDEVDMPGTKVDSKQRITVRNLRIREDTAKYLRNLDPNSAYYDPKTRSMRDNPYEDTAKQVEEIDYGGENFVRLSGDTRKHGKAQLFAWEAYEKGVDVHLLAEPTKLELLQKDYEQKKDEFKNRVQQNVLQRYGGEEHLEAPSKQLLLAQTEDYVEYSRYGKVIKGHEKSIVKSRYEEDVFPSNHTSVWGSYWHNGSWGYKCCYSFIKQSYCTGEAGKPAIDKIQSTFEFETKCANKLNTPLDDKVSSSSSSSSDSDEEEKTPQSIEKWKRKLLMKELRKLKKKEKKDDGGNKDKLKDALKKIDEDRIAAERLLRMDERKRPYNSMFEVKKPTDEDMEAYYMKRKRDEDPMAHF